MTTASALEQRRDFKIAVIGSGAGGAPSALECARELGEEVVLIEQGRVIAPNDINQIEREMLPALYARGGAQTTKDGAISVLQGVNLGGSTFVNDGLCFLPPEEMQDRFGQYGARFSWTQLLDAANAVQDQMNVSQIPKEMINYANYLLGLGAARIGLKGERLYHNSPGCVQCGFRSLGCAYGLKQSTNLSYIPQFVEAGGALHTGVQVDHLRKTAQGWEIHCKDRTYTAQQVILAAGVVQTPAIMLRSGFNQIGAGTGLQFHVQTIAWGDFAERVDGHNGIPMSYGVLSHSDIYGNTGRGYMIEGVGYQPMAIASLSPFAPAEKEIFLQRYRHLAGGVMLLRSSSRGSVSLAADGSTQIQYKVNADDYQAIQEFYTVAAELYLAAGADRVWLAHKNVPWVDKPRTLETGDHKQALYTAHPFGGACVGTTIEADHSVRGQSGLYVMDASAFPEALGVNPMITIAAMSTIKARELLQTHNIK